jgi:hypothetical protein
MLVFSGGIGEHNKQLRQEIGRELSFIGKFAIAVLPSQEDAQIAFTTLELLSG